MSSTTYSTAKLVYTVLWVVPEPLDGRRDDVVQRGRQFAADPCYPSPTLINFMLQPPRPLRRDDPRPSPA
jgi:hypothetical protein